MIFQLKLLFLPFLVCLKVLTTTDLIDRNEKLCMCVSERRAKFLEQRSLVKTQLYADHNVARIDIWNAEGRKTAERTKYV